jgi:polyhydroxyalkanoate synthesis repressor PhaR
MAKNNSDEAQTLEIRKYQNRRYYDSTRSRHLSLQQIHKLIIGGYNIRVLDAKTNEDITSKVLTQILLEYEPVKLDIFSNELLTRAIRVNDRLLKDFVDVYFRQAFEAFCGSQKQVDQMLRQAHHLTSILPAAASSTANLFRPWMPFSTPLPSAPAPASESNEDPGSAGVQNELAALRAEVSKLKAQFKVRRSSSRKKQKRQPDARAAAHSSQQGQGRRRSSGRTSETGSVDLAGTRAVSSR